VARRIRSNTKTLALTSKCHFDLPPRLEVEPLLSCHESGNLELEVTIRMSLFICTIVFLLLFNAISVVAAGLVGTPISVSLPADNFTVPSYVIRYGMWRTNILFFSIPSLISFIYQSVFNMLISS
jgi:hypothetical protein